MAAPAACWDDGGIDCCELGVTRETRLEIESSGDSAHNSGNIVHIS